LTKNIYQLKQTAVKIADAFMQAVSDAVLASSNANEDHI